MNTQSIFKEKRNAGHLFKIFMSRQSESPAYKNSKGPVKKTHIFIHFLPHPESFRIKILLYGRINYNIIKDS